MSEVDASSVPPAHASASPAPSRKRARQLSRQRWVHRVVRVLAGTALGLGIAEAAFHLRDDGGFPHLNLYVADAELGVRLRPGSSQRLAFPNNPVTSIRVGADGLRGKGPPPESDGDILVVGDSQVFGLGVEEHETASAALGRLVPAKTVINGGVPTYGPAEYNAVVRELSARRRIGTVVYVVNMVNDLFEASRPNVDRHAVWDGWAVRKETAPGSVTSFPGREWLFTRSHLAYAVRTYFHRPAEVDGAACRRRALRST